MDVMEGNGGCNSTRMWLAHGFHINGDKITSANPIYTMILLSKIHMLWHFRVNSG